MSHDTFPNAPDPSASEENLPADPPVRVVHDPGTFSAEQLVKWFLEARAEGADFAYHRADPPQTRRKIMLVAEGVETATVLRVLLDDYTLKDE